MDSAQTGWAAYSVPLDSLVGLSVAASPLPEKGRERKKQGKGDGERKEKREGKGR